MAEQALRGFWDTNRKMNSVEFYFFATYKLRKKKVNNFKHPGRMEEKWAQGKRALLNQRRGRKTSWDDRKSLDTKYSNQILQGRKMWSYHHPNKQEPRGSPAPVLTWL